MQEHQADVRSERERTRGLFAQLAATREEDVRNELVVAHLNLVRFLALKFSNRGEPLDDLIQVGTVGLLKAIDRFELDRGVEFTTYATPTIVGEIKRYFRDKGWAVKVPRRLQELNLAVNRASEKLTNEFGRSPTVRELAERLGASEEEILEAQELGQSYNMLSLDSEVSHEGDKNAQTLADTVGVTDAELEMLEDRTNLERAFHVLTGRERVIIHLRFYEGISQTEIAKRLNVSQMHISRLQAKALEKLRAVLAE
jgi:RNA polymerase sigma-B factor